MSYSKIDRREDDARIVREAHRLIQRSHDLLVWSRSVTLASGVKTEIVRLEPNVSLK